MSGLHRETIGRRPEPDHGADQSNSLEAVAMRVMWLLLGVTLIAVISAFAPEALCELEKRHIEQDEFLKASAAVGTLMATIWAIQSYWRLALVDKQAREWRPSNSQDDWSDPYTFHVLAESHKEWAQLWFTWCIAIFLGGVTYAIFSTTHSILDGPKHGKTWCPPDVSKTTEQIASEETKKEREKKDQQDRWDKQKEAMKTMKGSYATYAISGKYLHHGIVYLLFCASWYWAAKHYRSHWHNFVTNAYRHRALFRIEQLQRRIQGSIEIERSIDGSADCKKAQETILELYRLSGILLLVPGDSSYLDKVAHEEVSKVTLELERVSGAFKPKEGEAK